MATLDVRDGPGGARLSVHVQPNASRPGPAGLHGTALKVRVDAPPLDGRANARLCDIVAVALQVPRRAVAVVAGETSRAKVVAVEGLDATQVRARLGLA